MAMRLAALFFFAGAVYGANLAPALQEWKPGGEGEALFRKQADGREALGVRGGGEDSHAWRTGELKLQAGGAYAFRYCARVQGSSGTIVSGLEGVNRDFGTPGAWTTCGFAFRVPDAGPSVLRLGQWQVKGEVLFHSPELYPVQAVHRRWGDLVLGEGERLEGGIYTDTHTLHWRGSTIHRTLIKQNVNFNSNRWCFGQGSNVVYRYTLPVPMKSGEIRVNVNYHTGGTLVVCASRDGQNWSRLALAQKVGSLEVRLPAELVPTKELFVRLHGEGKDPNFQVDAYHFRAEVEDAGETRAGKTTLLEERQIAAGLRVTAGPAPEGLRLRWVNEADTARRLEVEVSAAAPAVAAPPAVSVDIPAKGEAEAAVAFPPLPAGVHTLRIAAAENKVRVCEWSTEVTCTVISESAYGSPLPAAGPSLALWWCEGGWKVGPYRPAPLGAASAAVSIGAARGEHEAAQLVLNAKKAGVVVEKAEVGDLTNPQGKIPAAAISLFEVATVKIENPSDYLGEPGEYPDPLPPLTLPLTLPANRNQALWILVRVPEDAAAGDYEGNVAVRTNQGELSVPLKVHVFDFALPKETHLRSGFGLDTNEIRRYHKLKTREQELEVYDLYLQSFAQHRIAPYSFFRFSPIQVKFDGQGADKQVKLGWDAFDAAAEKYLAPNGRKLVSVPFNSFMLEVQGLGGGTFHSRVEGSFGGFKAGTPEYERLIGDYLKQLEAHLKEKGWLKKAYVYWFDEPDPKDYPFVVDVMQRMKKHAPGLCRMLTEQPEKELLGHVDLWCGLTPEWTPQKVAERRAAGEEVWWYICCGPKAPHIGLFIEHPGVELRLWGWQSWQYGVQGILIWSTNYWTSGTAFPKSLQNPWQDPMSYVSGYGTPVGAKQFWGNGDGRFFYPPRRDPNQPSDPVIQPPISSLRWEALRDGVEDYEYFVLLKETVEKARGKADAALLKEAEALLTVPESISKNTTAFTSDVRPLLEHRSTVARMIERLGKLRQ